jgi:hypothetical protein
MRILRFIDAPPLTLEAIGIQERAQYIAFFLLHREGRNAAFEICGNRRRCATN